ncbi:MAG: tRNA uridine-5-carboxymethylaminomethyl(34) synthesis GTPase MnmE [Magnetococcales bacterium]|nr:tRNA uridine-5-carboxymethylaminomethyl(34) synthesis GTPase MnmE [Magnetococcales bacterium]
MSVFLNRDKDCICALATPWGRSAIAIVRLSGPHCLSRIGGQIVPSLSEISLKSKFVRFARFMHYEGHLLDHVVLVYFPMPHSYTGEDSLEIQCHGSPIIIDGILETLQFFGFRLAGPGEFTRRAFLHGKIDLLQAESIQHLISANNIRSVREHLLHLEGHVSLKINDIKNDLLKIIGDLEADIDFPEEDIEFLNRESLNKQISIVHHKIAAWLQSSEQSRVRNHTPSIIIVGRPNVGKSTFFNSMLGWSRSIVSEISGTTRDYIQEMMVLNHFQINLIDTAGIREDAESIEQMGIQRSKDLIKVADLILFMVDALDGWKEEDNQLLSEISGRACIVLMNKHDLVVDKNISGINQVPKDYVIIPICAKDENSLDFVKKSIVQVLHLESDFDEAFVSLSERQIGCVRACYQNISGGESLIGEGADSEIVVIKFREALENLAELNGEDIRESLLDHLFSQFCIGK